MYQQTRYDIAALLRIQASKMFCWTCILCLLLLSHGQASNLICRKIRTSLEQVSSNKNCSQSIMIYNEKNDYSEEILGEGSNGMLEKVDENIESFYHNVVGEIHVSF